MGIDWQHMSEADKFKAVYKRNIKRYGADGLLKNLELCGFFEAPASTKYHGAYPGGLVEHSNNVFRWLFQIATAADCERNRDKEPEEQTTQFSVETLAIVALLHDVCKMDEYHRDETGIYKRYTDFPFGHGEKSVILITQYMDLTPEEMLAIRWHMGGFDHATKGGCYDMNSAYNKTKLAPMLHIADMAATHLTEGAAQ